jgi:palmitoyltransferase
MLPTHISLILKGRTTLESFATQTQERVEEIHLKRVFDSRCPVREIRRARKHWDAEYGGVEVNDRWAFGRPKDRWRQEMGKNVFGWIRE